MSGRLAHRPIWLALGLLPLLLSSRGLAQITLRKAAELTANHRASATPVSAYRGHLKDSCEDASQNILDSIVPSTWVDTWGLTATESVPSIFDLATQDLLGKSSANLFTGTQSQASVPSRKDQRGHAVLCTAVAYANLANVHSQLKILRGQEAASLRLLNVEAQRVVSGVDEPVLLTRAEVLMARTRMWVVALEGSAVRLRKQLAEFTGLPEEQIELAGDSMPPLPDVSSAHPGMQAAMRQVTAARNLAQLEHTLAHSQRVSTKGKAVVGKANLGDLLAMYIAEDEKLVALLETNFALERTKLKLLEVTGRLEEWAMDAVTRPEQFSVLGSGQATTVPTIPATTSLPASRTLTSINHTVRSIMITPAVSTLETGQSRHFSAIAIYGDGAARDETSEAAWRCSSNSDAIVSTSGLVTALAVGQVTVTATVAGVSQSQQIAIVADDSTALNP